MGNVLLKSIETKVNKQLLQCEKKGIYNFRITEHIRFFDEIWDFNNFNVSKRLRTMYRFDFTSIPDMFKIGIKMVLLNRLFRKGLDFSTCQQSFNSCRAIVNYFKEKNVDDIRLIDIDLLKQYFEEVTNDINIATRHRRAKTLKEILQIYYKYDIYDGRFLINYLDNFIECNPEKRNITSKNEYIPDQLFNQVISLAVKDLNDSKLLIRHRIVAGMLILLAETGMRVEELSLLETNMLKQVGEGNEKVSYLNFYTFKITPHGEEKRLTESFLTNLALYAYNKLCSLRDEIISNLFESSKLRLMIQLKEDKLIKKTLSISELRSIVQQYPEQEMLQIKKEIDRFIYIDYKTGLLKRGGVVFRQNLEEFFVRHYNDFNLNMLSNSELEEYKVLSIKSKAKYEKIFPKSEKEKHTFSEIKKNKYIYINPHAFRVTLCTKLFLKGVHLDYIVKHLNHLSEDMTMYYNKSNEFQNKLENTIEIFLENSTEDGLIESDPDKAKDGILKEELKGSSFRENIDSINKFLQRNKFNINSDVKKIMKFLKKVNSPLVENSLGICIVSVVQKICERRKYFSGLDDNYYIGIQLETYKNINNSYERFKQKIDIINHNKQVAILNPEYTNEFEREVNALKYYINKTIIRELDLLYEDIENRGKNAIIKEYSYLEDIVNNFDKIRKEVSEWKI